MPHQPGSSVLNELLSDLHQRLEGESSTQQAAVDQSLHIAERLLYQQGSISESNKTLKVMATHQISGVLHKVQIPIWHLRGKQLHYDTRLVDQVQEETSSTSTIFQKIPQGYLRIATNVLRHDGTRAVNTYIPNTSPVVKTIENHKTYRGVAFVVNDWYAAAYKPILLQNQVKGMLYVGVREPLSTNSIDLLSDYHHEIISILSKLFADNPEGGSAVIPQLIHLLYRQGGLDPSDHLLQLGLRQLIIMLIQASSQAEGLSNKDDNTRERLTYIAQHIRFNLNQELDVQDLAGKAHMSQSTFFRTFKSYFGLTPTDYINRERVVKAYQLLKKPDKSVADVCFEVGYNNTSYFIKQFKMYHGLTPLQFKKSISSEV